MRRGGPPRRSLDGSPTSTGGGYHQPLDGGSVEGVALREPRPLTHLGQPRVPILLPHSGGKPRSGPFLSSQRRRGLCRLRARLPPRGTDAAVSARLPRRVAAIPAVARVCRPAGEAHARVEIRYVFDQGRHSRAIH